MSGFGGDVFLLLFSTGAYVSALFNCQFLFFWPSFPFFFFVPHGRLCGLVPWCRAAFPLLPKTPLPPQIGCSLVAFSVFFLTASAGLAKIHDCEHPRDKEQREELSPCRVHAPSPRAISRDATLSARKQSELSVTFFLRLPSCLAASLPPFR